MIRRWKEENDNQWWKQLDRIEGHLNIDECRTDFRDKLSEITKKICYTTNTKALIYLSQTYWKIILLLPKRLPNTLLFNRFLHTNALLRRTRIRRLTASRLFCTIRWQLIYAQVVELSVAQELSHETLPDLGHIKLIRNLFERDHLRMVRELLENTQSPRQLLFILGTLLACLQLPQQDFKFHLKPRWFFCYA